MLFFLLLLSFTAILCAQENEYEGKPIAAVRVQPDTQFLHPSDLERALELLKPGQPLRMDDVRDTIEKLYSSGRFEDISLNAEMENVGVVLRFDVTPARFVRIVSVDGVPEPPNRGQLSNATKLELGAEYSQPQVRQSVESLLEMLRTNGFYLAKIEPDAIPQPFQQIDLRFHADTGPRARFTTPIVKGAPDHRIDDIVRATRWKKWLGLGPWKEVTDARIQQGLDRIRRRFQKRNYLMARVTLEQMEYREAENRVVPLITVERGPHVVVRTRGAKISSGKLRELVPIYQELTVDRDLLVEGQREIKEYMQSRGYFEAAVDFDVETPSPSEQIIEYSIAPGARHKLVNIEITGNQYFDDATLRERMYTMPASFVRFRRGRFSEDYLRRDANAIRSLYQTNGFRDVQVKTHVEDDYNGKENEMGVTFEIVEGPQWFVASLDITGVPQATEEDLRAMMQSLEGQPYSELNVSADQDTVLNFFYNNGYTDATFEPTATPASQPNQVELKYTISIGNRSYVRDVLISGLRTTSEDLVRSRIRDLSAGNPLAQSSMIQSQRRLYDLGIFARVDTALQNPEGDTTHKYVLYRFEEASRYSLTGGFGAQIARIGRGTPSLDTPAGSAGFSPRISLGLSRSNFLGIGHTITMQTQFSNIRRRGLLTYLAPQFKGNDDLNLTITGLYDDSRDVQTFNSRRQEGAVQLSQRFTKANTVQYRASYRRVSVSDIVITPALIPLFSVPIQLATVSGTLIQDRRDDPLDARRGVYNTLDLALASKFWGSPQTTFSRLLGRNATYHRIGRDLVFARSTSIGVLDRIANSDVPLPERFFAGGATSHRGFPENQAGPRDSLTGFPVGGKALLINNAELRFPLLGDNIGGVFFHDAGNVYSSFDKVSFRWKQRDLEDFDYMVHAIGFGIRYRTPIGPVRVDLAYSVNSPRFMGLKGTREQLLNPDAFGPNCATLEIGCVQFLEQRISRFQFHFSLGQLF